MIKYVCLIINLITLLENIFTKTEFFSMIACLFILGSVLKINGESRLRSEIVKWNVLILGTNIVYDLIFMIIVKFY